VSGANGRSKARQSLGLLLVLAVLLGFASISTDLFLPALPTMRVALGASEGELNFTISAYLLGFGFGQLLWGPVSDRLGRRVPLAVGVLLFAVGSAGCGLSTNAYQIIAWRLVQALGASAGVSLARAIVRDLFERDEAARVLSTLMAVMAVAPLLGPIVGAQILDLWSWQAIFWTLVAIGLCTFGGVLTLPESLPQERRERGSWWVTAVGYATLLTNRQLLLFSVAVGFFYVGVFASVAGAPFAFISFHGLSPQVYALVFASGVLGLMAANLINTRLVRKVGSDTMLLAGATAGAAFGLAVLCVTATGTGGVLALVAVQFLFISANGLILANGVAGALASTHSRIGAASAVVGVIQYGGGMIGSALVGVLANGTPVPMGLVMAVGGVGCFASILWALR
jgi:DHA1 family bicyclomycin/chloramphenicol resistance-like MFS transporter